jgi:dienelactone hydrolase
LDLQVPAQENKQAIAAALEKGGNKDYTIQVFPKANHLFIAAGTGSPREYPMLKKEFVPGFLDLITQWIRAKTGLAPFPR